jgi:hypothetical protein
VPIDFIASIILIIIGKFEISDPEFLTNDDYKKSYKLYEILTLKEL